MRSAGLLPGTGPDAGTDADRSPLASSAAGPLSTAEASGGGPTSDGLGGSPASAAAGRRARRRSAAAGAPRPVQGRERLRRSRLRGRPGTAARLAAFQAGVLGIVLGIVVLALFHQFTASNETIAANALTGELHAFGSSANRAAARGESLFPFVHRYLAAHSVPSGNQVVVSVSGEGTIGTAGARAVVSDATVAAWLQHPPGTTTLTVTRIGGADTEVLAAPIRIRGHTVGTFITTTDLTVLERQRSSMLWLSVAEAAVAVAAGTLSAYLLLRRLLRTVGRITTAAQEIEVDNLDRRLGDQGTDDEVSRLASTFDAMLERIASMLGSQRRLLADVSHQLRTPMTVARGHLEVLQRTGVADEAATSETVAVVLDELSHMGSMVDQLLMLGRAIEPDFLQLEPVDLRAFFADVYEAAHVLADRRWSLSVVPDLVVWSDTEKLRGAVLNLVDNAVKFSEQGTPIALSAGIGPAGEIEIAVDDAGPGIPPEQRAIVLERFGRGPGQSLPGTGLGLSIVAAVARAHGGEVRIGRSSFGGARVSMLLPASAVWHPGSGDR